MQNYIKVLAWWENRSCLDGGMGKLPMPAGALGHGCIQTHSKGLKNRSSNCSSVLKSLLLNDSASSSYTTPLLPFQTTRLLQKQYQVWEHRTKFTILGSSGGRGIQEKQILSRSIVPQGDTLVPNILKSTSKKVYFIHTVNKSLRELMHTYSNTKA